MSGSAGLVIAGTSSGVGKTSLTLGLARALTRRSLRVQPYKVGPDFLDPTYLARATGRTCYNLDGWMTDREYVEYLFDRHTDDANLALIEGVMGMFDGADPASLAGSTAEIAAWLDVPVLLIVDAHGLSRSLAAIVKGFAEFEPGIRIVGVLANRIGSPRHRTWLADALEGASLPPLLGAVPRDAFTPLESRYLGLATADEDSLSEARIEQLADACEQHVDMERIALFASAPTSEAGSSSSTPGKPGVRIAVAHDAAFHFTYPDNLEALTMQGAELVRFSPLTDEQLPPESTACTCQAGIPNCMQRRCHRTDPCWPTSDVSPNQADASTQNAEASWHWAGNSSRSTGAACRWPVCCRSSRRCATVERCSATSRSRSDKTRSGDRPVR